VGRSADILRTARTSVPVRPQLRKDTLPVDSSPRAAITASSPSSANTARISRPRPSTQVRSWTTGISSGSAIRAPRQRRQASNRRSQPRSPVSPSEPAPVPTGVIDVVAAGCRMGDSSSIPLGTRFQSTRSVADLMDSLSVQALVRLSLSDPSRRVDARLVRSRRRRGNRRARELRQTVSVFCNASAICLAAALDPRIGQLVLEGLDPFSFFSSSFLEVPLISLARGRALGMSWRSPTSVSGTDLGSSGARSPKRPSVAGVEGPRGR